MSLSREFRRNPQAGLQTYSKIFLPLKDFLETKINELGLKVDIDELFPLDSAWGHICNDTISMLSRRRTRMKRKEAFDGHLKRPCTAFIFFGNAVRDEIRKAQPELDMPNVSKVIGKRWNALNDKKRQVYLDIAIKDRQRFEKERKEAYEQAKSEGKLFKELKPKRPLAAHTLFMQDEGVRARLKPLYELARAKDLTVNWLKFVKDDWDSQKEAEQNKYHKMVVENKKTYIKEMAAYEKRFKDYKEEELPDKDFEGEEEEEEEEEEDEEQED